jgi:hypothetical protein
MQIRRSIALIALAAASALTLMDCGKALGPASGTFGNVYETLKSDCIECHVPGGSGLVSGSTFDVTSATTAYNTLLSDTAHTAAPECAGVKLVVANTPTSSYLAAVLFSDYNINSFAGVANCKPITRHHSDLNLSADEKTSILAWINGGALNN